ncbi:shikimate kinase [Chelativorans intermedius]|uniref:Shikimate kinase n=1 Tax=Chelativorans intermedius TaxID=515947 RepID=A0ABV6DAQ9_9HYPH|nr:shikimate kinase [Chelativorans intermedius]MCT8998012.1 shikimate kinase [Chelativorans intermedius]
MRATGKTEAMDMAALRDRLGRRSIVLVGLMGAGKTVIGRRVAAALDLPFIDSDHEIERVSRMTIPELFAAYGEEEFRALERRVIARLLRGGPQVLSTGGGAFMNPATRQAVARRGISVWLKADLETLMHRVSKRQNRPLLQAEDPRAVMQRLMDLRYPVYQQADVTIRSRDEPKEVIAGEVVAGLARFLEERKETGTAAS